MSVAVSLDILRVAPAGSRNKLLFFWDEFLFLFFFFFLKQKNRREKLRFQLTSAFGSITSTSMYKLHLKPDTGKAWCAFLVLYWEGGGGNYIKKINEAISQSSWSKKKIIIGEKFFLLISYFSFSFSAHIPTVPLLLIRLFLPPARGTCDSA